MIFLIIFWWGGIECEGFIEIIEIFFLKNFNGFYVRYNFIVLFYVL